MIYTSKPNKNLILFKLISLLLQRYKKKRSDCKQKIIFSCPDFNSLNKNNTEKERRNRKKDKKKIIVHKDLTQNTSKTFFILKYFCNILRYFFQIKNKLFTFNLHSKIYL